MEECADEGEHTLKRTLGPWALVFFGIGAIIGAGIFVLTGEAAYRNAGPAVVLSFVAAGLACAFAGLCYAEFASLIPIAGSAYTYGYATLGELFAWIIGWDLILEYALAASTVSVGWSGYFGSLLSHFGIALPPSISTSTYVLNAQGEFEYTGGVNLTAVAILFFASAILAIGIRESAAINTAIVVLKVGIVVLFIGVRSWYITRKTGGLSAGEYRRVRTLWLERRVSGGVAGVLCLYWLRCRLHRGAGEQEPET